MRLAEENQVDPAVAPRLEADLHFGFDARNRKVSWRNANRHVARIVERVGVQFFLRFPVRLRNVVEEGAEAEPIAVLQPSTGTGYDFAQLPRSLLEFLVFLFLDLLGLLTRQPLQIIRDVVQLVQRVFSLGGRLDQGQRLLSRSRQATAGE